MSDHPQLVFGHFRVASHADGTAVELGRGAMGVTYKAFDERLRIDVALKLITPAQIDNPKAQAAFLREARAAARVHQTNVAAVVFLNDTPGNFFYAMEFVEGQPLRDWMRAHPARPPLTIIGIALQIAHGLEAIHEQQLVHRDLKPTNIMMVKSARTGGGPWSGSDPDAWKVKIIDFGLARLVSPGPSAVTQTAGFHGTALYASPEQCEERSDVDGRSDLYSLGCMMWEMLCGAPPFHARTHRELLNQHVSEPLALDRLAHVPPTLAAVVTRLLIKDPENRFPNATALIKALERCRDKVESGEEVGEEHAPTTFDPSAFLQSDPAPPVSTPPSTTSSSRRDLWMVAAAVLALVLPVLFFLSRNPAGKLSAARPVGAGRSSPSALPKVSTQPKSVAMLPFRNLNSDKESEPFAEGVQEEVISNLTKIRDLRTTSSTSVRRYRGKDNLNIREIAQELGVDSVIEASIQRVGNRIKVIARLVDAKTEQPIWTQTYEGTLGDDFTLQSEIAVKIAQGAHANLAPDELKQVNRPLSGNPIALDNYLQARGLMRDLSDSRTFVEAEAALRRAIELDPNFAQAHAQLAILVSTNYDWGEGRTAERRALAKNSAETAYRLQPDLPEAQRAMGVYLYRVLRDLGQAQPYLERALAGMPGNTDALFELAAMERRQGKWADAAAQFERIIALAPYDAYQQFIVARTYLFMHRYDDAWRVLNAALQRMPGNGFLSALKGELFAAWKGDLGPMREDLATRPPQVPDREGYISDKIALKLFERKFDEALRILRESDYDLQQGWSVYVTRDALEAEILTQAGRLDEARPIWRRVARDLKVLLAADPEASPIRKAYALALAGSGDDPAAALREARRAADELSVAKDAMDGTDYQLGLALVLLRNGDLDGAVEIVKRLRAMPSIVNDAEFKLGPAWDSIRSKLGLNPTPAP